ncbi:hypothetical protein LMG1860_02462 [Achromobacter denitrificans]|nr:hypothetical protein LMG1231_01185 [Achromobacter denitrificans]CAB3843794.1 hypothetical protein LMG1860_02462 [Achromobacter denitrificans]
MPNAASQNMTRQPKCSATKPPTTRDSRMPSSRPVITVPTIAPRRSGGASVAAAGTMSCAMVAARPTAKLAASIVPMPGAKPASSRPAASAADLARMMRLRS